MLNKTGSTLVGLYGGPSSSDDWGDNVLSRRVPDGDTLVVTVDWPETCVWDFRYEFDGKQTYEEYKIDVCEIDGEEFTIR